MPCDAVEGGINLSRAYNKLQKDRGLRRRLAAKSGRASGRRRRKRNAVLGMIAKPGESEGANESAVPA